MSNDSQIGSKELYNAAIQLITLSETATWNRFGNFLLANSILFLAWVTLYPTKAYEILIVISFVGMVLGVLWAIHGARGRKYHDYNVSVASALEPKPPTKLPRICSETLKLGEGGRVPNRAQGSYFKLSCLEKQVGSRQFLVWIPRGFSLCYAGLLVYCILHL